jgi:hypothetical protein
MFWTNGNRGQKAPIGANIMNIGAIHTPQPTPIPQGQPADKPNDGDADDKAPVKAATSPGVGANVDVMA